MLQDFSDLENILGFNLPENEDHFLRVGSIGYLLILQWLENWGIYYISEE